LDPSGEWGRKIKLSALISNRDRNVADAFKNIFKKGHKVPE